MPVIVMGARADLALLERQPRLAAFQGLALALFIAAENQRARGRVQLKPNDIPKLRLELGIVGKFEGARLVRLKLIGSPEPLHRAFGQPNMPGHAPTGPAACVLGRLDHFGQDAPGLLRIHGRRPARPGRLLQSRQAKIDKTLPPKADRDRAGPQGGRDLFVILILLRQEGDAGAPHHLLRGGGSFDPALQL